ncbi:MAG TPA: Fic family protein [Rubrivivax sp.]|nr:Fic family protein [Rubrivivax sp.]
MDDAELDLLHQLYENVLREHFPDRRLDAADIAEWHRLWLGNLYEWAGEQRSVNIGKGGFQFAAAAQIPRLLEEFERECLHRRTPCGGMDEPALTEAIALCHVELILIHPFREGNGRLSRLLADVMAVQGGRGPLDYSSWDADKAAYFAAIQHGLGRDYTPMQRLVRAALAAPGG